jgi:hypothetical protein
MLLALPDHYVVHSVLERKATDEAKKTGGTIGAKFSLQGVRVANTLEEFLADPELQLVCFNPYWLNSRLTKVSSGRHYHAK